MGGEMIPCDFIALFVAIAQIEPFHAPIQRTMSNRRKCRQRCEKQCKVWKIWFQFLAVLLAQCATTASEQDTVSDTSSPIQDCEMAISTQLS